MNKSRTSRIRTTVNLILFVAGLLLMALAILADELGLDLTPGFGVIQMVSFLAGLTLLTGAAYLYLSGKRPPDAPHSLQADIGQRLIATGLVFDYVTGLSDLIGIGTHVEPSFTRPFVGPLQLSGILIGVFVIVAGLVLYGTSRGQRASSSMEFLLSKQTESENEAAPVEQREQRSP